MPKFHPKSNNGVFSKKQKKSSRHMMSQIRHRETGGKKAGRGINGIDAPIGFGMLGAILPFLLRFGRRARG